MTLMDDLIPAPSPRNISNSEVTTFLSCKRQYRYAFVAELQPLQTADPLARGSIFHDAMHIYWRARMEGQPHAQSLDTATAAFLNPCEPTTPDIIMQAQFLWTRYMEYHQGFPNWKPLGTEVKVEVPLTSSLTMAIQYDFYGQDLTTGQNFILDYKLAYEFWKDEAHALNGQMPKYIAVLQADGQRVDFGVLEEIRTRPLGAEKTRDPKNLWRRTNYRPSGPKKANLLKQHFAASLEIEKFRALSPEEQREQALPVLNKHGACAYCNFQDLCSAELEGKQDLSVDIRVGYTQNSYSQGYNPTSESLNF